jgi:hypothetical protein
VKGWLIPEAGADFVCAMEEVLDAYQRPYDPQHPVVCLDESPHQLISETRVPFTDSQGIEYHDYEYKREGTADLYMIVEPLGARREVHVRSQHKALDWAEEVAYIVEEMYPAAEKITLIQDNLSAHKKAALYARFGPERAHAIASKLELIFTPKHGSWLNIAEIELSVLNRQGIPSHVPSQGELEQHASAWYEMRNDHAATVDWQFTTQDARIKLKRLYPSFSS